MLKTIAIICAVFILMSATCAEAENISIINSPHMSVREISKPSIFTKLPADRAILFQQKDNEIVAKYIVLNGKIKAATIALNKILVTEPFDRESYLKKVSEIRKIEMEKQDSRIDAIVELATKFTSGQRAVLIGAFEENSGTGKKRIHNSTRIAPAGQ